MIEAKRQLNVVLPAVAASVACMRSDAAGLALAAGASEEQADRVRLAVSEAVTNVVEHAYARGGSGRVQLVAAVENGELLVLVSDDGHGMSSRRRSRGLGLGLALMADACDGLTISARSGGGVEVQTRFVLAAEPVRQPAAQAPASRAARPTSGRFSTTT